MSLTDEAASFLDAHRVARLATADATGAPHVVPVCFARLDGRLYFIADDKPKRRGPRALKRLANIAANPRVALVVDDYDEDWCRLAFLLLHCAAHLVVDDREYDRGLAALRARYPQYRNMDLALQSHPMVRLEPLRSHFWRAAPATATRA